VEVARVGRFRKDDTTEMEINTMIPIYKKARGMVNCSPTTNPRR